MAYDLLGFPDIHFWGENFTIIVKESILCDFFPLGIDKCKKLIEVFMKAVVLNACLENAICSNPSLLATFFEYITYTFLTVASELMEINQINLIFNSLL